MDEKLGLEAWETLEVEEGKGRWDDHCPPRREEKKEEEEEEVEALGAPCRQVLGEEICDSF